ncbi:MAG: UDP-N-acetylmuramoyl-L-alanine--D-glutamate ligase [Thiotrichales bacterium]|nr:UDP-N-acetylmuramoyl-L-alanine--D-glutamate ligase [Thiotrichales bacterium]
MILVAGLGMTGESVLRFLQAQHMPCLAYDTRANFDLEPLQRAFPEIKFAAGDLPKTWPKQIETLVLSPGIALKTPWVQALIAEGVEVIGDIELFARAVGVPVIGITGSNGKSTVTTLIGEALKTAGYQVAVAGNIGLPALDALMDEHDYEVFVLELSSFQLETTYSLHCVSAAILNISEDHMDRYDDLAAYTQAKFKIFADTEQALLPKGFTILGKLPEAVQYFGLDAPEREQDYGLLHREGKVYLARGNTPLIDTAQMQLKGKHHQLNALAMMALCEPFLISHSVFSQVLTDFAGLPHRTQLVAEVNGVQWIDDSKGTNVGATVTALETFGAQTVGRIFLLAGGVSKEADFSPLVPAVQANCHAVILFGRDRQAIAQAMQAQGFSTVYQVETLQEAVSLAATQVAGGDCVLFSPACASFDQFKNYVERGQAFKRIVQALFAPPGLNATHPEPVLLSE